MTEPGASTPPAASSGLASTSSVVVVWNCGEAAGGRAAGRGGSSGGQGWGADAHSPENVREGKRGDVRRAEREGAVTTGAALCWSSAGVHAGQRCGTVCMQPTHRAAHPTHPTPRSHPTQPRHTRIPATRSHPDPPPPPPAHPGPPTMVAMSYSASPASTWYPKQLVGLDTTTPAGGAERREAEGAAGGQVDGVGRRSGAAGAAGRGSAVHATSSRHGPGTGSGTPRPGRDSTGWAAPAAPSQPASPPLTVAAGGGEGRDVDALPRLQHGVVVADGGQAGVCLLQLRHVNGEGDGNGGQGVALGGHIHAALGVVAGRGAHVRPVDGWVGVCVCVCARVLGRRARRWRRGPGGVCVTPQTTLQKGPARPWRRWAAAEQPGPSPCRAGCPQPTPRLPLRTLPTPGPPASSCTQHTPTPLPPALLPSRARLPCTGLPCSGPAPPQHTHACTHAAHPPAPAQRRCASLQSSLPDPPHKTRAHTPHTPRGRSPGRQQHKGVAPPYSQTPSPHPPPTHTPTPGALTSPAAAQSR